MREREKEKEGERDRDRQRKRERDRGREGGREKMEDVCTVSGWCDGDGLTSELHVKVARVRLR